MASGAINEVIQMEIAKVRQFNAERDEHERLRSVVVEAAQNLKRFQERHIDVIWHRELGEAQNSFNAAVQALNVFEAEHKLNSEV